MYIHVVEWACYINEAARLVIYVYEHARLVLCMYSSIHVNAWLTSS